MPKGCRPEVLTNIPLSAQKIVTSVINLDNTSLGLFAVVL